MEEITKDYIINCNEEESGSVQKYLTEKGWDIHCLGLYGDSNAGYTWSLWVEAITKVVYPSKNFNAEQISAKDFIKRFCVSVSEEKKEDTKFKVGDQVEVIDNEETYSSWFYNEEVKPVNYKNDFIPDNGTICEIITSKEEYGLYENKFLAKAPSGEEFVIGVGGIRKVGETKSKIGDLVDWECESYKGTGYLVGTRECGDNTSRELIEVVTGSTYDGRGWCKNDEVPESYKPKATNTYWWVEKVTKIKEPLGFKTSHTQPTDDKEPIFFGETLNVDWGIRTEYNFEDLSAPDLFSKGLEKFDSYMGKDAWEDIFLSKGRS